MLFLSVPAFKHICIVITELSRICVVCLCSDLLFLAVEYVSTRLFSHNIFLFSLSFV